MAIQQYTEVSGSRGDCIRGSAGPGLMIESVNSALKLKSVNHTMRVPTYDGIAGLPLCTLGSDSGTQYQALTTAGIGDGAVTASKIHLASADAAWQAGALVPSAPATNASVATGNTYIVQGPSLASGSARRLHVEWTVDVDGTEYQFIHHAVYRRNSGGTVTLDNQLVGFGPNDSWPSGVWGGGVTCSVSAGIAQVEVTNNTGSTVSITVRYRVLWEQSL
jgi:hypothetical protein